MCERGNTVELRLVIPGDLTCTGRSRFGEVQIDGCIASIVAALQSYCINMRGSCCGHGERDGYIHLQDGRCLVIKADGQKEMAGR